MPRYSTERMASEGGYGSTTWTLCVNLVPCTTECEGFMNRAQELRESLGQSGGEDPVYGDVTRG